MANRLYPGAHLLRLLLLVVLLARSSLTALVGRRSVSGLIHHVGLTSRDTHTTDLRIATNANDRQLNYNDGILVE